MTEQEKQLISGLAERIRNAPAPEIDRDANDLILRAIGSLPDALYILTQTVLIQEMALNQAKTQIEELKRQPASQQGGFIPGSQQPASYQPSSYQSSSYATQAPPPSGSGFSGFLHNAATTAAGVIAGELAFNSLASLFGNHGGFFGGGGGFFGGGSGISPMSETIVNNYYGDSGDNRDQGGGTDIDDRQDDSSDDIASDDSSFDSGGDGGSFDV